ncbi:unannotated protein [freshwater metagenome]|uniref:Unannotated protein n=1 Tax=freshwater metagenome TaxID=449393 RepID=A0A6J7VWH0_9ZZZZ
MTTSENFAANSGSSKGRFRGVPDVVDATNSSFTIRSSSDWKDITTIRAPTLSSCIAIGSARETAPNSSFVSIRSAWNVLFAGLPPVRLVAAGIASFTSAANSVVELRGALLRAFTIDSTMRVANFSSPYVRKIRTSWPGS